MYIYLLYFSLLFVIFTITGFTEHLINDTQGVHISTGFIRDPNC